MITHENSYLYTYSTMEIFLAVDEIIKVVTRGTINGRIHNSALYRIREVNSAYLVPSILSEFPMRVTLCNKTKILEIGQTYNTEV
jgi:hypothetical protein